MTAQLVSKTNVRYLTTGSKTVAKTVVAIKFRIFGETPALLKAVTDLMGKTPITDQEGKLASPKYSGWDLKKCLYFKEYITKDRATFQDAFKLAKKTAIELGIKSILVEDEKVADIAKKIVADKPVKSTPKKK